MFKRLISTNDELSLFVARVSLGIVMLPHGAQKLLGMFGGKGFSGTLQGFTEHMGMPWIVAFLVIMAESLGALALVFGFVGRFMAFGIFCVMTGAVFLAHLDNGFFMNWKGDQAGEGFEFHILAIGLAAVVILAGSGKWSIDRKLMDR